MIGLYDSSNTIKKLDIDYKKGHLNFLTLFNSTEANKYAEIYVGYQGSELLVLPLTGLIEKSGNKLQSLRINMDLKIDDMNVIANGLDKPDILTYVMSQCPNLKVINLWHAFLYCDDSSLFDIKPLSREIVYLVEALIHPAFFYGLSYYAPYIKKFIIANCNFTGNLQDSSNIFIDMPRTEFGSINCQDTRTRKDHIFLMLTTTINKKTVWYYGSKKNNYRICRESDYKNSLKDERCLSVFMRCKSTNAINIVSLSFDMSIKT